MRSFASPRLEDNHMADTVRITMMGSFLIYINEQRIENPVSKSRKGTALMEFLVLHRGRPVPNQQLLRELMGAFAESRQCSGAPKTDIG